ncbi:endonuclease/exonuclease/phosphatase family protein [Sulfitobacter sp. S190]|nr:endonuclease/exonuclease/phosphatase family protein [Sulfitobacter sp. S190]
MIETSVMILWGLCVLMLLMSVAPLSKLPHGAIRGLAFPRQQLFWAGVGGGVAAVVLGGGIWLVLGFFVVAVIQAVYIAKFTPFWWRQSVAADDALLADTDRHLALLAANVKKSNRSYDRLVQMIQRESPDIAMAIEVDQPWIDALKGPLERHYPHWIEVPLDTGYGMCVMSKLKLSDWEVREVITEGVPSIRTVVELASGGHVRLYVVHPEPPIATHDTKGRDGEIALVGLEAERDSMPTIVTGDLNDVAWSTTTRRFQRLSGLLDPRVGRGFYNTFSAFYWWARWPLDHLFHDPQFRLIGMERLGKIGSDHFPMMFKLALANAPAQETDPGAKCPVEEEEVRDMIAEERDRKRTAIGSDWEDE